MKPSAQKEERSAKCTGNGRRLGKTTSVVYQCQPIESLQTYQGSVKSAKNKHQHRGRIMAGIWQKKILIDIAVVKSNKHQDDGEKTTHKMFDDFCF